MPGFEFLRGKYGSQVHLKPSILLLPAGKQVEKGLDVLSCANVFLYASLDCLSESDALRRRLAAMLNAESVSLLLQTVSVQDWFCRSPATSPGVFSFASRFLVLPCGDDRKKQAGGKTTTSLLMLTKHLTNKQ